MERLVRRGGFPCRVERVAEGPPTIRYAEIRVGDVLYVATLYEDGQNLP